INPYATQDHRGHTLSPTGVDQTEDGNDKQTLADPPHRRRQIADNLLLMAERLVRHAAVGDVFSRCEDTVDAIRRGTPEGFGVTAEPSFGAVPRDDPELERDALARPEALGHARRVAQGVHVEEAPPVG